MAVERRRQGRPPVIENARDRILDEAAMLFARNGYDSSSLGDVAAAIGATKAAVYHYFPTKRDIYDAIIVRTLAGQTAAVQEALAGVSEPRERLRRFMTAHAGYFERHYWDCACMFVGYGGMEGELKADAQRLRAAYEGMVRDILRQGVADGVFGPMDVATAGRAVLSMLNWMARWFKPGQGRSAASFAEDYCALILNGLATGVPPA